MVFKVTPTKYFIKDNTITFWCNLMYPELKSIYKGTYVIKNYGRDDQYDMNICKYKDTILSEGKVTIRTKHVLINKQLAFCSS